MAALVFVIDKVFCAKNGAQYSKAFKSWLQSIGSHWSNEKLYPCTMETGSATESLKSGISSPVSSSRYILGDLESSDLISTKLKEGVSE